MKRSERKKTHGKSEEKRERERERGPGDNLGP